MKHYNRKNDDLIISLLATILWNGTMVVETINESVLVKLMQIRWMDLHIKKTYRDIEKDYDENILFIKQTYDKNLSKQIH